MRFFALSQARLPIFVIGEKVVELHAEARFGHHGRNRIPPDRVMPCFFVRGGGVRIPINFHQHKARRLILLLDDVEARDARFFQARARIGERHLFESLHTLRLDMNMNVNNEHGCDEYAKPAKSSSPGTGKIKVMALDENFQRAPRYP
jgi:hypothetical protein